MYSYQNLFEKNMENSVKDGENELVVGIYVYKPTVKVKQSWKLVKPPDRLNL